MATRFELVLRGSVSSSQLRAAGEEAIREIERIESKLSFYRSNSLLSRLNATAGSRPVVLDHEFYIFLTEVAELSRRTRRAFDPTVGPLMKAWGLAGDRDITPGHEEIEQAVRSTGIHHLQFNEPDRSVRFKTPGLLLDPGAVGKGYAIDRAARLLRESGVDHALIHGGTSTVRAWGESPDGTGWRIVLRNPVSEAGESEEPFRSYLLIDEALSVSTIMGKTVEAGGKRIGHILDPRSGLPVEGAILSACTASNATVADACSTAMLVLGADSGEVMGTMPEVSRYVVLLQNHTVIEQ